MVKNIQLSANFELHEFLHSETAEAHGIIEQYEPSDSVIDNLRLLCVNILQPLRDELKDKLTVTSGYRCQRLNDILSTAPKSQHMTGNAVDFICKDMPGVFELLKKYPFDQLINESNLTWIHVSYNQRQNRKQVLKI